MCCLDLDQDEVLPVGRPVGSCIECCFDRSVKNFHTLNERLKRDKNSVSWTMKTIMRWMQAHTLLPKNVNSTVLHPEVTDKQKQIALTPTELLE